jgi:hypothetical protein
MHPTRLQARTPSFPLVLALAFPFLAGGEVAAGVSIAGGISLSATITLALTAFMLVTMPATASRGARRCVKYRV